MVESDDVSTQEYPIHQTEQLSSKSANAFPAKKYWLGTVVIVILTCIVISGIVYKLIHSNKDPGKDIQLAHQTPSITTISTITPSHTSTPVVEMKLNSQVCAVNRNAVVSLVKKFEEFQVQKNIVGVKSLLAPLTDKSAPGDKAEFENLFGGTTSGRVFYSGKDRSSILKSYQIISKDKEEFKEMGLEFENSGYCFVEVNETIEYHSNVQKSQMNRKIGFTITTISGDWKIDSYTILDAPLVGKFSAFSSF